MRRTHWPPRLAAGLAFGLVPVLVLGALTYGLRIPPLGLLAPLPGTEALDYQSRPTRDLSPLSPEFLALVFGEKLGAADGNAPSSASEPSVRRDTAGPGEAVARRVESHPLTNDDITGARTISQVPYTARTNTAGASRQPGEPTDCGPAPEHSVWYRYRPPRDIGLIANTFGTSYATTLGVFRGSPGVLERVGCDTDVRGNAVAQFAAETNTTYFFQIAGPAGGGRMVFNLDPSGVTQLGSVSPTGEPADLSARFPSISGDGRLVAFESHASNLVSGSDSRCPAGAREFQQCTQIYVRDRARGTMMIASVNSAGEPGNAASREAFLSGDGRYVAFTSHATNLVPGDTNRAPDVYVHDLVTRRTERVSVSSAGVQSRDEPPTEWGDYTLNRALYGDFGLMFPSTSWDGRYIAFQSLASNLVPEDNNHTWDVFVRDRTTGRTERVSVSSSGEERGPDVSPAPGSGEDTMTPSISGNGRVVSFRTSAANLVAGDNNQTFDTFVHDRVTHKTERITHAEDPFTVTDDGEARYTTFQTGSRQGLSFDGRYVAFTAQASVVVNDGRVTENLYVHDRLTHRTVQANVSSSGEPAQRQSSSRARAISADGRYVAFHSDAPNLVPGDDNEVFDVFLHDLWTRTTIRLTVTAAGRDLDAGSSYPAISADGSIVAFESAAAPVILYANSVSALDEYQIYVHERPRRAR